MLLKELIKEGILTVSQSYPETEAREMVFAFLESSLGTSRHTHIIEPQYDVPESAVAAARSAFARMASGEPVQYVVGKAYFYGREFNVTPDVLIPRPETEILCREVCDFLKQRQSGDMAPKILDLCTGSGCIAWTLALENPGSCVTAVDISDSALAVASGQDFSEEMSRTGASAPCFMKADVLAGPSALTCISVLASSPVHELTPGSFDILVSNPPYVMDSEKALMRPNVLDHEPHLALFVPDSDPLLFYRAIAVWAHKYLRPSTPVSAGPASSSAASFVAPGFPASAHGGLAIVEINEALGPQTADLYRSAGFSDVRLLKDLNDKDRFVVFRK